MALFSKRKKNEEFKKQLEREALDKMDQQGGILPFESFGIGQSGRHPQPSHVITAAELNGQQPEALQSNFTDNNGVKASSIILQPQEEKESSGDFLYNRMAEARRAATQKNTVEPVEHAHELALKSETEKTVEPLVLPQAPAVQAKASEPTVAKTAAATKTAPAESKPFDLNEAINSLKNIAGTMSGSVKSVSVPEEPKKTEPVSPKTVPVQMVSSANIQEERTKEAEKPVVDSKAISNAIDRDISKIEKVQHQDAEQRRKTLLERCNAYLADDTMGAIQPDTSRYKLESVESILNGFEDRATQKVLRSLNLPVPEKAEPLSQSSASDSKKTEPSENTPSLKLNVSEKLPVVEVSSSSKTVKKAEPTAENTVKHISFQSATPQPSFGQKVSKTAEPLQDYAATRHIDIEKINVKKTPVEPSSRLTQTFKKLEQTIPSSEKQADEETGLATDQPLETDGLPTADYRTVGDKNAVLEALNAVGTKLKLRTFANALLFVISMLLITLFTEQLKAMGTATLFGVHLTVIVLVCLTNLPVFKSLSALFSKQKSCETALALAFVACALSSVLSLFSSASLCLPLSAPVSLAALFFSIGKNSAHRRICANFNIIANEEIKNATHIVSNHAANRAMGQRAVGEDVLVCCGAKTKNIESFLSYSYCKEPLVNRAAKVALVGLIMAFGLGIASTFITTGDIFFTFYVAGVVCCLAAAPATLLITNLPLRSAGKKLNRYGAMLTGYKACAELDRCNAVAVPVGQLFPEGSVCMVDMRPLSPNPIDKTILDAYSVTSQIGSPLAGMFRQINNTTDLVPKKADTVMYEEKMGVSGWVENHRVFVGNRILMEAHGFKALPPLELDKKILRKGYFPVYLACDNAVCAIFVVKYLPDEYVSYELSRLCNTGTTVLIKNCDPNISEKMLCDYFGLYEESVSIMNKQGCDSYDLASSYKESRSAGAGFGRSVCGFFAAVTAAIQIKSLYNTMSALYVVTIVLGILAAAITLFTTASALTPIAVVIVQLLSTVVVCLPLLFRHP